MKLDSKSKGFAIVVSSFRELTHVFLGKLGYCAFFSKKVELSIDSSL
ncbi:MAG: hypothetical protein PWP24_1305 [Clostridiales bacterium]|nr:hypothetical protein [Clostridiales bacterium]